MEKTVENTAFEFIEKIYYLNENGKGFRSIGEWIKVGSISSADPSYYNFNEHQVKHLEEVIKKYDCAIIMKEAYADKYRIHDPYSFGAWFLANIYGALVYEDYEKLDDKIKQIFRLINNTLNDVYISIASPSIFEKYEVKKSEDDHIYHE